MNALACLPCFQAAQARLDELENRLDCLEQDLDSVNLFHGQVESRLQGKLNTALKELERLEMITKYHDTIVVFHGLDTTKAIPVFITPESQPQGPTATDSSP